LVIERFIEEITGEPLCGLAAREIISRTAHMVKARSVAYGAGMCIFAARLAEAMGAVTDLLSTLPGKGRLVHQILALALPRIFYDDRFHDHFLNGSLSIQNIKYIIEKSFNDLIDHSVVDKEYALEHGEESINASIKMISNLVNVLPTLIKALGMSYDVLRLYTELLLYSYRYHIVGVIDALIEDPIRKKAIVIEWKTGKAPLEWEMAQGYVYSLLEADRLGYDDPIKAVKDEHIIPIVIRPAGRIQVYSISDLYRTADRKTNKSELLDKIILSSEHLVLTIASPRKFIKESVEELCKIESRHAGRKISGFRRTPDLLPRSNPLKRGDKYPCNMCPYREACLFYIASYEEPTKFDSLMWRARFAVYDVRENALQPLKELYDIVSVKTGSPVEVEKMVLNNIDKLEKRLRSSNNRVDYFEYARIDPVNHFIELYRPLSPMECSEIPFRPLTLREGKPVLVIFRDLYINNLLMRLSFHGRIDEINIIKKNNMDYIVLYVSAPNMASRLSILILDSISKYDKSILEKPLAIEVNVDLTQLELQAIDAFHRATKELVRRRFGKEAYDVLRKLYKMDKDYLLAYLFLGKGYEE